MTSCYIWELVLPSMKFWVNYTNQRPSGVSQFFDNTYHITWNLNMTWEVSLFFDSLRYSNMKAWQGRAWKCLGNLSREWDGHSSGERQASLEAVLLTLCMYLHSTGMLLLPLDLNTHSENQSGAKRGTTRNFSHYYWSKSACHVFAHAVNSADIGRKLGVELE